MDQTKKPDDANPNGWPLFVSTTGKPVLLALLSGHSDSVGTEPKPLHPRFHRIAVLKGVMPANMAGSIDREEEQSPSIDRKTLLLKAIADMVAIAAEDATKQPELFTNDGRPDARAMAARLGFPVSSAERDEAWAAYSGEGEAPAENG